MSTPPSERSLVLVKPDAVRRGLVGEIVGRFERKGLVIEAMELRTMDAPWPTRTTPTTWTRRSTRRSRSS